MLQFRRQVRLGAAALAFSLLAAAPAAADVKSGVDAWQKGDFGSAVRQWRALADKGDADAQFNMGQAYKLGRGVPADLKIAQSWYQKAAQQGHEPAQALLGLILFENGQRAAAVPWLKKAADHGDPRAQYVLGTGHFNGDMVPKDLPRAYALMLRARDQGMPLARARLADMDKFVPQADRQKGIAIARQMEMAASTRAVPQRPTASAALAPQGTRRIAGRPAAKPAPAPKPVAVAAAKPAAKPAPAPVAVAAGGKWRVQLGAYGSPAAAQGQWSTIARKVPALAGLRPSYEQAGAFTRLRVGPLANRAAADRACAAAKGAGQACFAVAP
jgi:cell division septation protein DedD